MNQSFRRGTGTGKFLLANWRNRLIMLSHIMSAVGKELSILSLNETVVWSRTDIVRISLVSSVIYYISTASRNLSSLPHFHGIEL